MSSSGEQHFRSYGGLARLWAGWIIAPTAWALHLQISYMLVPWACLTGREFTLHLTTVTTLLIAGTGGLIAWRCWRETKKDNGHHNSIVVRRSRFLALLGLLTSLLFFTVIAAQGLPNFFLDACL